jgi:hypothetical protein
MSKMTLYEAIQILMSAGINLSVQFESSQFAEPLSAEDAALLVRNPDFAETLEARHHGVTIERLRQWKEFDGQCEATTTGRTRCRNAVAAGDGGGGTYAKDYDGPGERFHPEKVEFHYCRLHCNARIGEATP